MAGRSCLNVTCVQFENGKSISPIDSAQPTMAHDADTESDLARPPDGKHPGRSDPRAHVPALFIQTAGSGGNERLKYRALRNERSYRALRNERSYRALRNEYT
jgi:hypothetical protein